MIYITIILVAIIIAGCILGYKYIDKRFDPNMYEQVDVTNVTRIIESILLRCNKYESCPSIEQYKYSISEEEIKTIMEDIAYSLNLNIDNINLKVDLKNISENHA